MTTTPWNYSDLAAHYDRRADYAPAAIDRLIATMGLAAGDVVADIGAGTGKLARPLAERGLIVRAVEPNDEMRAHGVRNTGALPVTWRDGTAEDTGLAGGSVRAVTFGSSFNVIDQAAGLRESRRIVEPRGSFCCLWNHRDLDDPLQARIEGIIRDGIPGYSYGTRREDPTAVLRDSGLFGDVQPFAASFTVSMTRDSVLEAWRSHATLARQAGDRFDGIVTAIGAALVTDPVAVPYTTRGWCARFRT
jgi:SAM-dependent methyltransferase